MSDDAFATLTNEVEILPYEQKLELLYILARELRFNRVIDDEPNQKTLSAANEIKLQVEEKQRGTKDIDAFFAELDD
ncbi:MAG: hypothetical protein IKQ66_06540 [Treponema sp.]|nr:hypothetical protein [Treponema sp.]MBR6193793.1 hypothetical protein [Treponema sp.]MBR6295490.1 hypothetical protein [Treponema sp.]